MERLMQREIGGYGSSPKTPESDDMDFKDVFGGPPRRFSMQEVRERYSFGESSSASSPWEKPVFGEEKRARQKGADFFDDIFKGSPRRSDRDGGSNPGSRIMSPARPKPDPLASSLPAHFSLPAKLTKSMDLPTFGSHNHKVDGLSSPRPWSPFSRFSNEASGRPLDDMMMRDDVSRQRPLSDEAEDSPYFSAMSDATAGTQFHFSIYKWAGRGVPMLMPLVIRNNLKYEKSASSNGRMEAKKQASSAAEPNSLRSERADEDVRSRGEKTPEQNHVFEAFYELSESKSKSSRNERIEKEVPVNISEGLNSELKPLHAFLDQSDQPETKDEKARAQPVHGDSEKEKEKGRKGVDSKNAKVEKSNLQGKGKVKEFVQIFNQDAADARGSRRIDRKGNEASSNQAKAQEQEVENLKTNEARRFSPRRMSRSTRSSSRLRKSFSAGMLHEDLKMSQEKLDDPLEDNFEVHELSDGNENIAQNESSDDTKAIDAKIRQWSVGKKGNIRSLLSTLQYVLWAESGWKPVPLVDLIESNSVKKAYQKALLRLHPDKLQQKGAAFHHKYIAEKVFDILQEAWDHFNTCSSLGI